MLEYREVLRQEYAGNRCIFSAGFTDHPIDTMYIKLEKDGVEPTILLFRPDEMASIAWLAAGVLWSYEVRSVMAQETVVAGDFCGYCKNPWPCGCDDPIHCCGICAGSLAHECRCTERDVEIETTGNTTAKG